MAKQIEHHMALENVEAKADEFINLIFTCSEEELRQSRLAHPKTVRPRDTALAAAALSVQESIKAFLAIARIERE